MQWDRVSLVAARNLAANVALVGLKAVTAWVTGSTALLAEAVHSGADVLASSGILVSARFASRPPDDSHPYGHGKVEFVATAAVAVLLAAITYGLLREAWAALTAPDTSVPGVGALWVALVCLAVKEGLYRLTLRAADRLSSTMLKADAWHHRADALILSGATLGIAGSRLGIPALDPLAAMAIAVLLGVLAVKFAKQALDGLMDASPQQDVLEALTEAARGVPGVGHIDSLQARCYGTSLQVDLRITVDADATVAEGHAVTKAVQQALTAAVPNVRAVLIHVNPARRAAG